MCSWRWSDVDFVTGRLTLTDETGRHTDEDLPRREIKGRRSRSFPLHPDLLKVLQNRPHQGPYVFYGPRGGRLKPDTVRRAFVRDVIEPLHDQFPAPQGQKSFQDGRLHSFRHAFCSQCANDNVPERVLMDWLGHQDSAMIRHYYHLHDQESQRRMSRMNFLGGPSGEA